MTCYHTRTYALSGLIAGSPCPEDWCGIVAARLTAVLAFIQAYARTGQLLDNIG